MTSHYGENNEMDYEKLIKWIMISLGFAFVSGFVLLVGVVLLQTTYSFSLASHITNHGKQGKLEIQLTFAR